MHIKHFKLPFFLLLIITSNTIQAQTTDAFNTLGSLKKYDGIPVVKKKSHLFQIGAGIPNNLATLFGVSKAVNILGMNITKASDQLGPFYAGYDYFVSNEVSIGLLFSYTQATQTITDPTGFLFSTPVVAALRGYSIGITTGYHFYTTNHFDPYIKGAAGYNIWNLKSNSVIPIILPTPYSYSGLIGVRYFPAKWIAPFGELSYGSMNFCANFGVAFKFN
jgi:hypothetical protein